MIITSAGLLAVAEQYAARPDDWPVAVRFDPQHRWYARFAQHPDHEVWLLSWLPGQATDLHDHGGSAGAFVVVSGTLTESTVVRRGGGSALRDVAWPAGRGHQFGAHHVHRVANLGNTPAVSVHAYGPALRAMTRYRFEGGTLALESITRAGADW
jgi:predicted metal-dependent enzyme (double-stranded beta helix superfamily)